MSYLDDDATRIRDIPQKGRKSQKLKNATKILDLTLLENENEDENEWMLSEFSGFQKIYKVKRS